jgi:hypothetical protein
MLPLDDSRVATHISAKGAPLPITRRSLLAAAVSLTLPAAAHATQADSELTALGARFEQALVILDAAQRARDECERRYLRDGPEPPPILTSAGTLGTLLRHENAWWSARELRWLLKDEDQRADWPAARAALRAALSYEARDRRFRRKLGLRAAEKAHDAAIDAVDALASSILAAPARSAAGFAVQARAVKCWGKPEWWSEEASHADMCERFAARLIDDAIAVAA